MEPIAEQQGQDVLRTLPGDDVRQIMWRFADRYDLQMLVQSARAVARGPVARLVAEGARNSHDWTDAEGPAAEGLRRVRASPRLSWSRSRAGSSRGRRTWRWRWSPSSWPGWTPAPPPAAWPATWRLAPIHERGTPEQRDTYMRHAVPPKPGEDRKTWRGAFGLTEPLPYVGVETGLLGGQGARRRVGGRARSRSSRWTSAAGSSPTWASPTSSPPRWTPPTRASRAAAWSSWRRPTRRLRPRRADQEAGAPALLDPRPGLQPAGARQPHHRRLHGQGRRDRPQLQPRRDHRGGVPPHARDRRADDRGQAALGGRAGHPLPARPLPRAARASPRARRATTSACSRRRTSCTGWWTSGPPARPAPRSASPRRACSTSSTRSSARRTRIFAAQGSAAARAQFRPCRGRRRTPSSCSRSRRKPEAARDAERYEELEDDPLVQFACAGRPGQRALPGLQALEHRPRRQHDARSGQPDGRLRHHRGLPRLPGPEMDGRPARGHLRRPRSGPAPPAVRHDDQRAVPGPVRRLDRRDARHRLRPSRHRRLHAGHGDAALALDAAPSAGGEGRRRRQALSQQPPGRDVPAGRRALLAAGRAQPDPGRARTGGKGAGNPAVAEGLPGVLDF